jgi:hypothetical protein
LSRERDEILAHIRFPKHNRLVGPIASNTHSMKAADTNCRVCECDGSGGRDGVRLEKDEEDAQAHPQLYLNGRTHPMQSVRGPRRGGPE